MASNGIDCFMSSEVPSPSTSTSDDGGAGGGGTGATKTIDHDMRQLVGMNGAEQTEIMRVTSSNVSNNNNKNDDNKLTNNGVGEKSEQFKGRLDMVQTSVLHSASSLSAASSCNGAEQNQLGGDGSAQTSTALSKNENPSAPMSTTVTTTTESSNSAIDEAIASESEAISTASNQPSLSSDVTPSRPPRRQLFPPNTAPPPTTANNNDDDDDDDNARNNKNTNFNQKVNELPANNNATATNNYAAANRNAFDAFGDFLTVFFRKAEVYEEELERHESQRALLENDDFNEEPQNDDVANSMIEGGSRSSSIKKSAPTPDMTSPRLSPTMEAMAAVEAMSSFRNLSEVKLEKMHERESGSGVLIDGGEKEDEKDAKKAKKLSEEYVTDAPVLTEEEDESIANEWRQKWKIFCGEKKKNRFNEIAIEKISLPLSVDEFYQIVIQDNATHSIGKFMSDIGEVNVQTTTWIPSTYDPKHNNNPNYDAAKQKEQQPSTRTIHYVHPISAPMAPPTAKANKTQHLHKFGPIGLCLETCTVVEDVPMTDCFVVDDRLWVYEDTTNANDGSDKGQGCIVEVAFRIRFVKSTMFRRIIENSTRTEFNKFWGQFGDMITKLESPRRPPSTTPPQKMMVTRETRVKKEVLKDFIQVMVEEEFEEGVDDVPMEKLVDSIRKSTRRLSTITQHKMPSGKGMMMEVKGGLVGRLKNFMTIINNYASTNNGGAMLIWIFALVLFINLLALRQMIVMSQVVSVLNERLETMGRVNEALLLKLSENDVCN